VSARDPHDSASFRRYLATMPVSGFVSIVAANAIVCAALIDGPWRFFVCGLLASVTVTAAFAHGYTRGARMVRSVWGIPGDQGSPPRVHDEHDQREHRAPERDGHPPPVLQCDPYDRRDEHHDP
jgi:hypothetical protein